MDVNLEFILKGKGSDISCNFNEPIIIPTDIYEARIGLKNFATYNSIPNVDINHNNQLKVKVPGHDFVIFSLDTGAYEMSAINTQLQEWIEIKYPTLKDVDTNFKLLGNEATSKAEFLFKDDYGIDFNVQHSMHELLGFKKDSTFTGKGRYIGSDIVDIAKVTQLIFLCNVTDTNYINGEAVPFLYNCGINVPSGFRLSRELTKISYKRLTTSQLSHIRIWIVDQNGYPIDLREDVFIVTLSLRLKRLVTPVSVAQR